VEDVDTQLNRVLASIKMLDDAPASDTPTKEISMVDIPDVKNKNTDSKKLAGLLNHLYDVIKQSNPTDIGIDLDAVKKIIGNSAVQKLENQLDDYDYEEALETLEKIAGKIGVSMNN